MLITNRYHGLIFLKEHGFPVPDFIKVDSLNQLKCPFFNTFAQYGWTLRTCKRNGKNEISLFYKNNITKEQLIELLRDRLVKFPDEFYLAYHSWDFYFSFNIIKTKYQYIIEGKFGSQKSISSGDVSDFISIEFDRLRRSFNGSMSFDLNTNSKQFILNAINYLDELILVEEIYAEVAITKNSELFFYEFWFINKL